MRHFIIKTIALLAGILFAGNSYADNQAKIGETQYATLAAAVTAATEGQTVTLLTDVTEAVTIPAGKTLTLDLNGRILSATSTTIIVAGNLTVQDTSGEHTGKIVSTSNVGIGFLNSCNGASVTFNSGTIEAVEGCIITSTATGSSITINGGTFTCSDNAVISGNGSEFYKDTTTPRVNPNTITINGGTFNGRITSPGYVACGVYAPWKDNVTISGGTFNITNGCGVLGRAGDIRITGGTFITTGSVTGKVGDSRVVVPCSAVVYDSQANYPAITAESKIEIPSTSTATFTSEVAPVAIVKEKETPAHIEIAGGKYSAAVPEEACTSGYEVVRDAEGNYVAKLESAVEAKIGDEKFATLAAAITAATAGQTITLLSNITLTADVTLPTTVTLDLGAYTITDEATNLNAVKDARLVRNEKAYVCYADGKNNWAVEATYVDFTITDGIAPSYPDGAESSFIVPTATYTRNVGTNVWGTICVPFNLKSCDDYTLYNIESIDGTTLTVEPIDPGVNVPAGTPVIFKNNTGVSAVVFRTTDATVSSAAPTANGQLLGTYTAQSITTELATTYFINGDKFHQAQLSLTVPAYRAYIKTAVAAAKQLSICVLNEDATDTDAVSADASAAPAAYYDLHGRKHIAPQRGITIANGKKYMKQ